MKKSEATLRSSVHHGQPLSPKGHWIRSALTSGPGFLWELVFLGAPLLIIGAISFCSRGAYGELELPLTLDSYKRLLGFGWLGFDPVYPVIFLRSLTLGGSTALICAATGLPLAFFIAKLPERFRTLGLVLVVIPFWTNLLIRTYAWQILLSGQSPLAWIAHCIGIGRAGEPLYPSTMAVAVGMVCDFLPFLVLPLYASVEKIDWSLAEAAMDLGANHYQVFRHALLPQIAPGLIAGMVLVFLPATGQFVIPDLLGGAKTVMLGNAIQQQFSQSRDWPFGSAIAVVGLAIVMAGFWLYQRKSAER